jgi:hypothetical protein
MKIQDPVELIYNLGERVIQTYAKGAASIAALCIVHRLQTQYELDADAIAPAEVIEELRRDSLGRDVLMSAGHSKQSSALLRMVDDPAYEIQVMQMYDSLKTKLIAAGN